MGLFLSSWALIAKTGSRKIGALTLSMKFLFPEVALCFCGLTSDVSWNTVVISRLVIQNH